MAEARSRHGGGQTTACPPVSGGLQIHTGRDHERRWPPLRAEGANNVVPGEALAEDTRFELVRGCPQHAFQRVTLLIADGRVRTDLRWTGRRTSGRTPLDAGE